MSKGPDNIIDAEFTVVSGEICEDFRSADRIRISGSNGAASSRALRSLAVFAIGTGLIAGGVSAVTGLKTDYSSAAIPPALEQSVKDIQQQPITPKVKPGQKDALSPHHARIAKNAVEQTARQLQNAFGASVAKPPTLAEQKAAVNIASSMLKTYRQHLALQERKQNAPKPK